MFSVLKGASKVVKFFIALAGGSAIGDLFSAFFTGQQFQLNLTANTPVDLAIAGFIVYAINYLKVKRGWKLP